MSSNSREEVWDVFAKAIQVFDDKNNDYGDAWRHNGWRGNLSRVFEKAARVRNLVWRSDPRVPAVGDESAVETLRDMLNTIAFAIINLQEEVEWGGEKPRSQRLAALEQEYVPGEALAWTDSVSQEIPHGFVEDPSTKRIMIDPKAVQMSEEINRLDPTAERGTQRSFDVGPDEQGAALQKYDRVPRKPRGKAVTDAPQA